MKQKLEETSNLKKIFSFIFDAYICFSAFIGFLVFLYLFLGVLISVLLLPVSLAGIPIDLGNGFVCVEHPSTENNTRMIMDNKGDVQVQADIESVAVNSNTVYGRRTIWRERKHMEVYYICVVDEDCSNSQSYSKEDFDRELKIRNLLPLEKADNINIYPIGQAWAAIKLFFSSKDMEDYKVNVATIEKRY